MSLTFQDLLEYPVFDQIVQIVSEDYKDLALATVSIECGLHILTDPTDNVRKEALISKYTFFENIRNIVMGTEKQVFRSGYEGKVKVFYAKIPVDAKVVRKINCPHGIIGHVFTDGEDIVIPILYDPTQPDEDWAYKVFKVLPDGETYSVGSYRYLGTISKDKIFNTIIEVL